MKRVLKNMRREHLEIKGFPRGKDNVWFRSKTARVFDMDVEKDRSEYYMWLKRFGVDAGSDFVIDITARVKPYSEQLEMQVKETPKYLDVS